MSNSKMCPNGVQKVSIIVSNVQKVSKLMDIFWTSSWLVSKVIWNVQNMSIKCPKYVHNVSKLFKNFWTTSSSGFQKRHPVKCWTQIGHFLDSFWAYYGDLLDTIWTHPVQKNWTSNDKESLEMSKVWTHLIWTHFGPILVTGKKLFVADIVSRSDTFRIQAHPDLGP